MLNEKILNQANTTLGAKDRQLLYEVELNARASAQELGRRCKLSKETTIYRLRRLEERGIIERYTTLVDFAKLGYTGFAVYSRLANIDEAARERLITYLSQLPECYWIAIVGGTFDIVYGLLCTNVFAFNHLQYAIRAKFGKYLMDSKIVIRTELQQHRRSYIVGKKRPQFSVPYFGRAPASETIDELDERILNTISLNARMPAAQVAERLGEAASTIVYRVRALEKRGIIQGYWAYVRPLAYGVQSYRLLLRLEQMNEQTRNKLFSYVHHNPHMLLAIETVGDWQFEITLDVATHAELQREISTLRGVFTEHIRSIEFLIMFEDDLVYDPYPLRKAERAVRRAARQS